MIFKAETHLQMASYSTERAFSDRIIEMGGKPLILGEDFGSEQFT